MLETERLIIRNFKESDLSDYWEISSNVEARKKAGLTAHTNIEDAKLRLARMVTEEDIYAIVCKENSKVIGEVLVYNYYPLINSPIKFKPETKEIACILSDKYTGKGYMSEALKVIIDYLFKEQKVPQIVFSYLYKNKRSQRLQNKLNFPKAHPTRYLRKWTDGSDSEIMQSCLTIEEYNKIEKRRENGFHAR